MFDTSHRRAAATKDRVASPLARLSPGADVIGNIPPRDLSRERAWFPRTVHHRASALRGSPNPPRRISAGQQAAQENQQLVDRAAGLDEVEVPRDDAAFEQAVDQARADGAEVYRDVATDNLSGGITSADEQLRDLAAIENTESIQEAQGNLADAHESLEAGDLSSAGESLTTVNAALPNIVQEMGDKVGEDLREQVDAAVELQTEAVDVAEETAENADQAETGDDDIFDDGIVPDL